MFLFTLRTLYQVGLGALKAPALVTKRVCASPGAVAKRAVELDFRCWPIDMDVQMHMNNSCYLRVAELARWRLFSPSGMMGPALKKGWLFLAVEQTVTYYKPIPPMAAYRVEVSVDVRDDKWIMYKHRFLKGSTTDKAIADSKRAQREAERQARVGVGLKHHHNADHHDHDEGDQGSEVVFCEVDLRAVMKERSGKTVRPSELLPVVSAWNQDLFGVATSAEEGE
jgi:acyl-CoA thioesterase FadM